MAVHCAPLSVAGLNLRSKGDKHGRKVGLRSGGVSQGRVSQGRTHLRGSTQVLSEHAVYTDCLRDIRAHESQGEKTDYTKAITAGRCLDRKHTCRSREKACIPLVLGKCWRSEAVSRVRWAIGRVRT